MAVKEIKDYSAVTAAAAADKLVVQQAADNVTRYITPAQIIGIYKAMASGLASLNSSTKVVEQPASISDHLDDTAGGTDAQTAKAATSNVVYDHGVAATGVHGVAGSTVCSAATADSKDTAAIAAHNAVGDPHTGYRLESADHTHASAGMQGGVLVGLAVFSGVYDSGWFAVANNTGYNKTHNLGAIPKLFSIWFSQNADGSAAKSAMFFEEDGGGGESGIGLSDMTTTTVRILIGDTRIYRAHTVDGNLELTTGYCRVVLVI